MFCNKLHLLSSPVCGHLSNRSPVRPEEASLKNRIFVRPRSDGHCGRYCAVLLWLRRTPHVRRMWAWWSARGLGGHEERVRPCSSGPDFSWRAWYFYEGSILQSVSKQSKAVTSLCAAKTATKTRDHQKEHPRHQNPPEPQDPHIKLTSDCRL